ncbi:hypothetical protein CDL12_17026 [Handroanthus impetiginosus]|uniref:SGS domain-containing protein n=1 Tax=Handroanthus impetiginosus TaxID=429701 RepID=A0A2G9GYM9_9LAMI|nr:hypothetical protein CDL12_17026 [Handroanthus impetiginosus]
MATSDLETKAKEAFIDDHFELAVDLYSQAIALNPNSAELFADRAQANIKLRNFTDAIADANKAIELNPAMAKGYLRKGMACIKLEEYQTAKTALETGASLAPGDSRFTKLIKECDEGIAEEAGELPKQLADKTPTNVVTPQDNLLPANGLSGQGATASSTKPKYRSVGIIPAKCRYDVMSTKIEIRLAKADLIHWTSLEYTRDVAVVQKASAPSGGSQKPAYPSSKPRRVDWDKLEAQVKKEEKEEKLDGDAALNKFFRDIYLGADEDTRRAMSKSFVESNGTVLSTNWKEVGSKKVEGSAPDGMELKKWEY